MSNFVHNDNDARTQNVLTNVQLFNPLMLTAAKNVLTVLEKNLSHKSIV